MKQMKLTRLSYKNFKGGTDVIDITGREAFFGKNGTGKSRYGKAVTVGMLGYDPCPNLGIEPKKNPGEVIKLISDDLKGSAEMIIGLEFNDGDFAFERKFLRNGKGVVSQEITIQGEEGLGNTEAAKMIADTIGSLPAMFNPKEFFQKSVDKRMEFIRPFLPDADVDALDEIKYQALIDFLGEAAVDAILEFKFDNGKFHDLNEKQKLHFVLTCAGSINKSDPHAANMITALFAELNQRPAPKSTQQALHSYLTWIKGEKKSAGTIAKEATANVKSLMAEKATAQLAAAQLSELKANHKAVDADLRGAEKDKAEATQKEGRIDDWNERLGQLESERNTALNFKPVDSKIHEAAKVDAGKVATDLEEGLASWKEAYGSDFPKADGFEKTSKDLNAKAEAVREEISSLKQQVNANLQIIDLFEATELMCPECGYKFDGAADDKKKIVTELEARSEGARRGYEAIAKTAVNLSKKFKSDELHIRTMANLQAGHQHKLEALTIELDQDAEELKKRNARCREIDSEILELQKKIQAHTPPDLTVLDAKIDGLTGELARLTTDLEGSQRAAGILEQIEKSSLRQMESDKKLEVLKTVEGSIKSVRNRLSESSIERITKTANELLQAIKPEYAMGVILEDEKGRETFELTMKENGVSRLLMNLSGGETVLTVFVAFVTALIDLANPPFKMLMLESAETDDVNLSNVLKGTGTILEKGYLDNVMAFHWYPCEAPPGWSVHVLGD